MGFYGTIFNRVDKFWNKIKINNSETLEALDENLTLELESNQDDLLISKTSNNIISISANPMKEALTQALTVTLKKDTTANDGSQKYILKQGNTEVGQIDIILDSILANSEIIYVEDNPSVEEGKEELQSENEGLDPGTYLKLTFNTLDGQQIAYINVTDLNEIAGEATDTITINVDTKQNITASVNSLSITSDHLANNAVTEDKIADEAVTTDKIVDDAVTTDKIVDEAITTDKIKDDAVTTDKIADDAVITGKIADDAVTTDKIVDKAIVTEKVSSSAITSEKLASSSVTTEKIQINAITRERIADNAVIGTKIADNAISSSKIRDGEITLAKISDGVLQARNIAYNDKTTVQAALSHLAHKPKIDYPYTKCWFGNDFNKNYEVEEGTIIQELPINIEYFTGKYEFGPVTNIKSVSYTITMDDREESLMGTVGNAQTTLKNGIITKSLSNVTSRTNPVISTSMNLNYVNAPDNSLGEDIDSLKITDEQIVREQLNQLIFYRAGFYEVYTTASKTGTAADTSNEIRALKNSINSSISSFKISIPEGTKRVVLALPSYRKIGKVIDQVAFGVDISNQFIAKHTNIRVNDANGENPIDYTVYAYSPKAALSQNLFTVTLYGGNK